MDVVETARAIVSGIGMGISYGSWEAVTVIKRKRGTCLTWPEYEGRGDSPESALAALKQAVADGEEGWTW